MARGESGVDSPTEATSGRRLAGHEFVLSEFVPPPFAITQVGLVTGIGFARLTAPEVDDFGERSGTASFSVGALEQIASFRVAPSPYFGLRATAAGIALIGTDVDSALTFGASAGYDLSGGALATAASGRVRLSGSFDVGLNRSYRFNLVDAIVNSVNEGKINRSTLLVSTKTTWISPGLHFAVALHDAVGVWASIGYRHEFTRTDDTKSSDGSLKVGGALSVDFNPVTPLPVGLLGTYAVTIPFADDAQKVHELTAGFLYTGRSNLLVGPEGRMTLSSLAPGVDLTAYEAIFGLRYFW
ncbi:MAG: hypothetical protein HYY06_23270 [Deltaproteobacteria bacterium]|nr:hypothetical protein [Deltaproteobacteria bacterium]